MSFAPTPAFSGLPLRHDRKPRDLKSLHRATKFSSLFKTKTQNSCPSHSYHVFTVVALSYRHMVTQGRVNPGFLRFKITVGKAVTTIA